MAISTSADGWRIRPATVLALPHDEALAIRLLARARRQLMRGPPPGRSDKGGGALHLSPSARRLSQFFHAILRQQPSGKAAAAMPGACSMPAAAGQRSTMPPSPRASCGRSASTSVGSPPPRSLPRRFSPRSSNSPMRRRSPRLARQGHRLLDGGNVADLLARPA